jgi:hypothetical protein
MKIREAIPIVLLLPIFGFIAYEVVDQRIDAAREAAAAAIARAPLDDSEPPAPTPPVAEAPVQSSEGSAVPVPDPAPAVTEIRNRIASASNGTYINEIIAERDSGLARWPERIENPLRIWVQSADKLPGWDPGYPDRVREAFDTWSLTGVPIKFTYVRDSVDADVVVVWVDRFETAITGRTLLSRDRNWWITSGSIALALHHTGGEGLDQKAIHAIALHEVGHLLGLDHCADTANIMTPKVRVRELSDQDRATMKLLYSLPAGSLRN